ncbi:hypothetical protein [Chitinophaga polysaccharea]|uniref:hypothetical protein n=1 Tax=Chitinophaga polysaccharea TaxID=1293035 RepID=UPI001158F855|nr:hypothetical protein [Chitinophaga polysaccharea]
MKNIHIVAILFLSLLSSKVIAQNRPGESKGMNKIYKAVDSLVTPLVKEKYDEYSFIFRIKLDFDWQAKIRNITTSASAPDNLYKKIDKLKELKVDWKEIVGKNVENEEVFLTIYYMKERKDGTILLRSAHDVTENINRFADKVISEKEINCKYHQLPIYIQRYAGKNDQF